MMTIEEMDVTVGQVFDGYINNDEQGVRGYGGLLDIRPPYQREFIYNEKEQRAVITTVIPLAARAKSTLTQNIKR